MHIGEDVCIHIYMYMCIYIYIILYIITAAAWCHPPLERSKKTNDCIGKRQEGQLPTRISGFCRSRNSRILARVSAQDIPHPAPSSPASGCQKSRIRSISQESSSSREVLESAMPSSSNSSFYVGSQLSSCPTKCHLCLSILYIS